MLNNPDLGKLILRQTLGALLLFHGLSKLLHGVSHQQSQFQLLGLPGDLAYLLMVAELMAPIMLMAGFHTRLGAMLVLINTLVGVVLMPPQAAVALTQTGAWYLQTHAFFAATAVAILCLGPGRYKVKN